MRKPGVVTAAIILLWVSVGISFVGALPLIKYLGHQQYGGMILGVFVGLGFNAFLNVFIMLRKNWARITYLIVFSIGVFFMLTSGKLPNIFMMAMEIVALCLLFTKDATLWFRNEPNQIQE